MGYLARVNLYIDGGCRGNPGPGAVGIVIYDDKNKLLHEYSECIGHCTNNQAEYHALIRGLDLCAKFTRKEVVCFSDSDLLVKQMNGIYRLKNDALRDLWHVVMKNSQVFESVIYQHIRRNNQKIQRADHLLNNAQNGNSIDNTYE